MSTIAVLVLFALSFSFPSVQQAQLSRNTGEARAEDTVKLNTRLVNLNVSVMDRQGKKVTELKREDFLVYEDGVQQEVAYFDPVAAPVNVVLLMDLSGSIAGKLGPIKKAAKKFIESLKKDDHIAVATFTSGFNLVSGFTNDKDLLKDRIGKIKYPQGDTAFYDAAWSAFDLLDQIKDRRKGVVILTDGVDSSFHPDEKGSSHSFDDLMMQAVESDASVYPIYFDTEPDSGEYYSARVYSVARKQLQDMAEQTGGTYYSASRIEDLDGVYQRVSAELHSIYSLAYAAKDTRKDGRWRAIKVKINRESVAAVTKRGYIAK